jgi:hypothetical protein
MLSRALVIRVLLSAVCAICASHLAGAQIDPPSALSEFSGCAHHTCAWSPLTKHKTFSNGDLSYSVETNEKQDAGGDFVLRRAGKELLRFPLDGLSSSASVVWSNDKKNFAVTWAFGGDETGFRVRAFHIEGNTTAELPATRAARDDFDARYGCEERSNNVQAYSWFSDSRTLVLAVSVYSNGDCGRQPGRTEGYVVDAPSGRVLKRWNLKQLHAYMAANPE